MIIDLYLEHVCAELKQFFTTFNTVIGFPNLTPIDLRYTYGQLAYQAGVPLAHLSRLLGFDSITSTCTFLNLTDPLADFDIDFVPLE